MRVWLVPLLLLPLAVQAQSCNGACEARKAEVRLLKPGVAERHGDRLVLSVGPGKMVFDDNKNACAGGNAQDCAVYALVAAAPGSLAIRKFAFEGSDSFLIDSRSGRKTLLTGVPVFAPSGRAFIVTQFSNDSDNNLEVWRRDGDGARLEWAHPFQQSFADDPALKRYPANPALRLPPVLQVTDWKGERVTLSISTDDRRFTWPGTLSHDPKGWHLAAQSPPGLLRPE